MQKWERSTEKAQSISEDKRKCITRMYWIIEKVYKILLTFRLTYSNNGKFIKQFA